MIKRLARCIREYKWAALLSPICMIGEVYMETLIPLVLSNIVDQGVQAGNMGAVVRYGLILVLYAMISLVFGVASAFFASYAATGFSRNLRHDMYYKVQTFDFELGGRGYMGGEPGGDIFDRACFGGGIEYGYSLPIARRLNIDFSAGIGYLGGKYYEYIPIDQCYVWQATKNLHYFGPTKVEVSLVWLIGRGNYNKK